MSEASPIAPGAAHPDPAAVESPADPWAAFARELDAWAAAGRVATLWWRDDDAGDTAPALDGLLALAGRHGVPVGLAVIPARATEALGGRLATEPLTVAVLQHGWIHADTDADASRQIELSDAWAAAEADRRLRRGWERLRGLFGARALPVMVPPWNRIDPGIAARLPALGYAAVSGLGARRPDDPGPPRLNVHADIMDWSVRGFRGEAPVLDALIAHLRDRRAGRADPAEPTGLMTHHLDADAACWAFLDRLFAQTCAHPGAAWADTAAALGVAAGAGPAAGILPAAGAT